MSRPFDIPGPLPSIRSDPCGLDPRGFSRRDLLRGAAATLTLPWLESLPTWSDETGKRVKPVVAEPPVRFACLYFSNGVEPAHWWAKRQGADLSFGPGLKPLQSLHNELVFLRGLYNEQAVLHKSAHLGRVPNLLSGAWVSTAQDEIRVGRSMDQLLAQRIGKTSPIPSLVLGIEPTELRLEDGLSMLYGSCISWASDTKPATKEIYPARVFDMLVDRGEGRAIDRSILDEVFDDAKNLSRQLAAADQRKLDDYLESIRDIERRLERAKRGGQLEGWRPATQPPDIKRPVDELPQDIPTHMKLMLDLIVLAFRMNKTRIATCMLNNDLSQMNFGFLEGVEGSLHLDLTHNGRDPQLEAMYLKTNQFHAGQFAYLIQRMSEVSEGERSLLGNSLLLFCSNLFDGDKHQADEMPMLLAGQAGGRLRTGRIVDVRDRGDDHRRACSLYLSLMDRMGLELASFGDSKRRLAGL